MLVNIIKFKSRTYRDKYFEKRFNLKNKNIENLGLGPWSTLTEQQHHKIYINESLSVFTKLLFKKTCDTCRIMKYNRWLTALTKIKFVEKYIPCMNAGLETSNSFGYARTAYDKRRANRPASGEAMRVHAQPHLRADQPAYISSCHTHTGSLTNWLSMEAVQRLKQVRQTVSFLNRGASVKSGISR